MSYLIAMLSATGAGILWAVPSVLVDFNSGTYLPTVIFFVLMALGVYAYALALSADIRRLHDLGLPGWAAVSIHILFFMTLFGTVMMQAPALSSLLLTARFAAQICAMLIPGEPGVNQYGPAPRPGIAFTANISAEDALAFAGRTSRAA